jgi:hypothetical protein
MLKSRFNHGMARSQCIAVCASLVAMRSLRYLRNGHWPAMHCSRKPMA